jgi:putative endonuclease
VGVTGDLSGRVAQHKAGQGSGFTSRYRLDRLVYAESTSDVQDALTREKQLKGWRRSRKVELIESVNPRWEDLSVDWGITDPSLRSGFGVWTNPAHA